MRALCAVFPLDFAEELGEKKGVALSRARVVLGEGDNDDDGDDDNDDNDDDDDDGRGCKGAKAEEEEPVRGPEVADAVNFI